MDRVNELIKVASRTTFISEAADCSTADLAQVRPRYGPGTAPIRASCSAVGFEMLMFKSLS